MENWVVYTDMEITMNHLMLCRQFEDVSRPAVFVL